MGDFHIRDVCRILDIKPHIIRYWEQEISEISPRKDLYGVRIYSYRDINLLFRINYLFHKKGFSISQIKQQLWLDMDTGIQNRRTKIQEIRTELIKLQEKVRNPLIK
ncbi:MAG: MerR family transcriptional regulator [Spirochaetales bacterium]|nr:MerR family transcriptional regulator [Spirochaetales bacterium]